MAFEDYGLLGIFVSSFLSYSIIPFPAEASIIAGLSVFNPYVVFLVVFMGSTLGSMTNYYLGAKGIKKIIFSKSKSGRYAKKVFDKYGEISLLTLSWLPFIGDPLIVLAGAFEMNIWKFLIYTTINKIVYFAVIVMFGVSVFGL